MTTVQVVNRGTVYRIHYTDEDPAGDRQPFYMLESGRGNNHGEWITLQDDSVAWSYLAEKLPSITRYGGDQEGWIMAFAEAGVEVFGA